MENTLIRYNQFCPLFEKMQKDTVNANIRKALQRVVRLDIIPYNLADTVDLPKARKFRCPTELQQLFEYVKGAKSQTVAQLAGYSGMRGREACAL